MQYDIKKSIEILERTPIVLTHLLSGLNDDWIINNEGENTWSPFDVVGHLIHGEEVDWLVRTKIILAHGESKTFEPFDRFAQFEKSKGKHIQELLEQFTLLRNSNLDELKKMNIQEIDLDKLGSHPSLGKITLRN
ncbi:MAG: DinB family protein, partial [Bacteroidota bacterium]